MRMACVLSRLRISQAASRNMRKANRTCRGKKLRDGAWREATKRLVVHGRRRRP